MPDDIAILSANEVAGIKRRDWLRVSLADGARIPLPVAGSASALKCHPPFSWRLAAEAPKASERFDATMATLYGRTPYFHLLSAELSLNARQGEAASELCLRAFRAARRILGLDDSSLIDALRSERDARSPRFLSMERDYASRMHPGVSIIDLLARLGPDAIFPLASAF